MGQRASASEWVPFEGRVARGRTCLYTDDVQSLLVVGVCLIAGLGLRFVPAFPAPTAAAVLNAFAIWVALPALILVQIPRLHPDADVLAPIVVPWLLLVLSVGIIQVAARLLKWSRATTGALMLVVPLGNTSFLGIPLTAAWLGPDAVPYAVLYDQLGSFLALTVYGAFIVAIYAGKGLEPRATLTRITTFPPFIALLVALVFAITGMPPLIAGALEQIGASLVPVVMVAVGLQWRLRLSREHLPATAIALSTKLVIMPLAALAIVAAIGPSLAGDVAIFEAAMGPMITAGALAIGAGLEPELVSGIVGYGTLLSLGTSAAFAVI